MKVRRKALRSDGRVAEWSKAPDSSVLSLACSPCVQVVSRVFWFGHPSVGSNPTPVKEVSFASPAYSLLSAVVHLIGF